MNCGYTGIVSDNKKDAMTRLIPMLDQLRKGLQLYDLLRVINMNCCRSEHLAFFQVDAIFIIQKCRPEYSEKGSVRYTREVNVMNFFQDFLQAEVEDDQKKLTVGRVMQWITGQGHKPCLPSEKAEFQISVRFNHDCDSFHTICFPTVSACSRTITFPVVHLNTLSEFKHVMNTALMYGQSFYLM
uniref:HECT domain-containing protein n=1 Tax=Neogobius melanostomus TaxID=47308 RepID=A0A8C6SX85_9GOBI